MENSLLHMFLLVFLSGVFLLGSGQKNSSSEDTIKEERKPVLLEDIPSTAAFIDGAEVAVVGFFEDSGKPEALEFLTTVKHIPDIPFGICTSSQVLSHYNITQNTISVFRMVDNKRQDLEIQDGKKVDVAKLSRFIRINELRWVTEYNPMTAVGLFDSAVQTHVLLFSDKTSSLHTERINKYREAAVAFQGKALFILVDLSIKDNDRVLSYFHLKKSQLPALAAYYTADEEQDVLLLDEVSVERITDFCNAFLQRKEEKKTSKPEDNLFREEL
ncbi:endoplasmic reticulum resident protein 27 isoform X1 [Pseudonaja textilis]|uniref:endoplasmic reticulum resident protein 27 isoform X1 n=1 Tax=Pseudonaja textilis TaxID=8673 RepID=UPI000EA92EEA|nr:endoplasmic reticulum resident protein 27 isoform X1 [Pseudonaja textilis]